MVDLDVLARVTGPASKKGGFSMSNQSKSRKGLVVGIIAAVVVLIAVLRLFEARSFLLSYGSL